MPGSERGAKRATILQQGQRQVNPKKIKAFLASPQASLIVTLLAISSFQFMLSKLFHNSPDSVTSTLRRFTSVFSILRTVSMEAGSSTCFFWGGVVISERETLGMLSRNFVKEGLCDGFRRWD